MNTVSYNGSISNLWHYLQGLSLSASDSRWLADHLMESADKQDGGAEIRTTAKEFFGIWSDDGISADEAATEIRRMRKFNREAVQL